MPKLIPIKPKNYYDIKKLLVKNKHFKNNYQ